MYKHEKQAVERLQSNHIHMLSMFSTAIIAFLSIVSLSGTLLFPMMAFADEPQPVAQVGNATYTSVQDAIGHTSMKNNTITLLSDATESVTVTPPKVVRGVTLELNGHALNASNTTAITVPANMQLTITGSGTVAGGDNPAIDCRGALQIQGGNFTSNTTLMRFAETGSASADASISAGTFTAPTLIGMLDDAEHLGYASIRGGEYHGAIPDGLDTLVLMGGSFSTTENLTPYLADMAGLIPNGDDGMFDISELAISSDYPTVALEQGSTLQKLTNDSLLDLTRTKLNGISDYRLVADAEQLQALNKQIELALQAVAKRKAFDAVSQTVTITATRNETTDGGADPQFRTSGHDEISTQVTVNIKSIAKPEDPVKPDKPAEPKQPDMPRTGSAIQALAVASLLLLVAAAVCAFVTSRLRSS
ncbi:hypothetical protein ACK2E9_07570 [Bifidobacterium catenulatum]|uniref:hypothetical protein n=1 Tax=Bifidobacterium catenulatum TaxID=1686 RepID=UPI003D2F3583